MRFSSISILTLFGIGFPTFTTHAQPAPAATGDSTSITSREPTPASPTPGSADKPAADAPSTPARTTWMIVLATFRGEDQQALARDALKLAVAHGLDGAYIETRGPASVLGLGRFADSTGDEAKKELERVRATQIDGVRPFAYAFFAPPDASSAMGNRPQYNLLKAREQFGAQARFTLQVAAFGPADLQNPKQGELEQARADAEQAAAILRNEGELAYYYHGRSLSMVTVGVWDDQAFGDSQHLRDPHDDDPTLTAAKKRFPYNLYNGGGVKVKAVKGTKGGLQRSQLVKIPDA